VRRAEAVQVSRAKLARMTRAGLDAAPLDVDTRAEADAARRELESRGVAAKSLDLFPEDAAAADRVRDFGPLFR
jgi:hypothetical protein